MRDGLDAMHDAVRRASVLQSELDAAGVGRSAVSRETADTPLDIDLSSAVARLLQIDHEHQPDHFLWERVITCDVPRLLSYLTSEAVQALTETVNGEYPRLVAALVKAEQYRTSWS